MKGRGQVRAVLLTALITILLLSCAAGVMDKTEISSAGFAVA